MMIGAVVLARADFAFALVPGVAAVTAVAAALVGTWLALRAAHAGDAREASVDVVGSTFAIAIAGLALGAHSGAVALLGVSALSGGAFLIALSAVGATSLGPSTGLGARFPSMVRVARLAAVALTGAPLPIALARAGIVEDVARAEAFGMPVGWLLGGVSMVVSAIAAFALWRVCFVVFDGEPEKKKKPVSDNASRRSVGALAMVAFVLSLLALPAGAFGDGSPGPLDRWLTIGALEEMAAPGAPLDRGVRLGLVLLMLVVGIAGFVLARNRYRAKRASDWKEGESARLGHGLFTGDRSLVAVVVLPFTLLATLAAKLDGLFERTALGMPPDDLGEDDA
jgi:NADH:ubiquinone oxidoreductase subunit 5 (subunit L)/multisubunit Na+/H+ antiporter MnhA subunit